MRTARRAAFRSCLAVAAVVSIVTAAAGEDRVVHFGLAFPADIAGFTRGGSYDFEKKEPGLGYGVTYARQGWKAEVFIYDLGRTTIPEDPRAERIRAQFEQAEGDIFMAQQKGQYQNVTLRARYAIADGRGQDRLACGTFRLRRADDRKDYDSYLCVSGWGNKFVKFRATAPAGAGNDAIGRRFLEAWAKMLWPAPASSR
jgi:hypothetical protein